MYLNGFNNSEPHLEEWKPSGCPPLLEMQNASYYHSNRRYERVPAERLLRDSLSSFTHLHFDFAADWRRTD